MVSLGHARRTQCVLYLFLRSRFAFLGHGSTNSSQQLVAETHTESFGLLLLFCFVILLAQVIHAGVQYL